jgi:hypothetical protein
MLDGIQMRRRDASASLPEITLALPCPARRSAFKMGQLILRPRI